MFLMSLLLSLKIKKRKKKSVENFSLLILCRRFSLFIQNSSFEWKGVIWFLIIVLIQRTILNTEISITRQFYGLNVDAIPLFRAFFNFFFVR